MTAMVPQFSSSEPVAPPNALLVLCSGPQWLGRTGFNKTLAGRL
jgi:hypothetical protein